MGRILFFPVILTLVCGLRSSGAYPEGPGPKKVTTFVTYAYEQGDEPIQVPVPSGSFNTPELSADNTGPIEIENFGHPPQQQPDLARDLQPPLEVPQFQVPLQGPIPIPLEQPASGPPVSSPVKLEEVNFIHENDELKSEQVVETPTSKIFPAKTQSFQIIKAPMIQQHSVTSDGDFMKALAHAFGVTNRLVLHSQLERGLKAPEAITTPLPHLPVEETVGISQGEPITENPFSQPTQIIEQQKQSLQAALIQSLQRLNSPGVQISPQEQARENGVYQHIFSHASPNSQQIPVESTQSQVPPPPPQYQFTFHAAAGDDRKELSGPDAATAPKQVVIQEEGKVPLGQLEQGLYNTEVFSAPQQVEQQPPPPTPPQQQAPRFLPDPTPSVIRKFKPITFSRQGTVTAPTVQIANSAQLLAPVIPPVKFSDSTVVSKTTFSRVRPQVLLYRDQQGNIQQTTPSQLQEKPLNQQFNQQQGNHQIIQQNPVNQQFVQPNPVNQQNQQFIQENQQFVQTNPVNQQFVQETPTNQQFVQDNSANQQFIQVNPANQQLIKKNPANQQLIQENPANQQFIQENPTNQQFIQENPANQQFIQENPANQQLIQENQAVQENPIPITRLQQVFSPANALSGESQKQFPEQQQRSVYRYLTNEAGGGESVEQFSGEIPESSTESEFDSGEVEGKYAVFEPQKVIQNVNAAGVPIRVVVNGGNQFRRRRPNGRRLKVRRKKVKVRRLAPLPPPVGQ